MFALLFALAPAVLVPAVPQLSNAVVSETNAGACGFGGVVVTSAQIQVAWTLTNPDPTDYSIKVYENGVLADSIAGDVASITIDITGNVRGGTTASWTSNWTYRVDMVRKSDGVVVATATSNNWSVSYGGC